MEMPLTDRGQIDSLAKCYETLPSNIQRDYALRHMPKRCTPEWRGVLEEDKLRSTRLSSVYADEWLSKHLQCTAKRGFLTRAELTKIARWKYPGGKVRELINENCECEIQEISRASFAARSERLCIGALLALRGVGWPMASTILHFVFPDTRRPNQRRGRRDGYPILDVRVMRAVSGSTNYTFERWQDYTALCLETAAKYDVSLRVLDRALWTYDYCNSQNKSPATPRT